MGHRTLKRVPLDFQWPLNEVWEGYINPYPGPLQCNQCNGSGYNLATQQIAEDFYAFGDHSKKRAWYDKITQDEVQALVDNDCLWHFTHTWTRKEKWKRREDNYIPTAEEVNALQHSGGLNGHDSHNRFVLIETRARRLGVFGKCSICCGVGELPHPNEAVRKLYEDWEDYEPPTGDGYQLWETCSARSPQSPVFSSAELLADWCANNATIFGNEKTSRSNWLQMLTGEKSLESGSLLIEADGYLGSVANMPTS